MKLDELFDTDLGFDETNVGIYLLLKTVPNKDELYSYYHACGGDIECIYNRMITYNKGWQLIEKIKGRNFTFNYLKKILGIK